MTTNPKPKRPQPQKATERQERDYFRTPNYATDMIAPYLTGLTVWECAAGDGRMARRLRHHGIETIETDIEPSQNCDFDRPVNFLTEDCDSDVIVTNAPFSIKNKFIERCLDLDRRWALLLPAEWNNATVKATESGGQWIVPKSRIDYITPNILQRIHEGEVYKAIGKPGDSLRKYKESNLAQWEYSLACFPDLHCYESIDSVASELLAEYSASQFRSGWLLFGFDLPNQVNFIPLSRETKRTNV